jgi:hypothetical protein
VSTHQTDPAKKMLSKNLNRQLGQYALAAAVAGVSVMALADPAVAEVVVTRKTIPIPVGSGTNPGRVAVSLTNNGVNDVSFTLSQGSFGPGRTVLVNTPNLKNGVTIGGSWDPYARALTRGAKIGPDADSFFYRGLVEFSATSNGVKYCKGYWASNLQNKFFGCGNTKNKYMGVSFSLNNQTHFGWIRLTVTTNSDPNGPPLTATISGYAYETIPNKPILAGTAGTGIADVQVPTEIQTRDGGSLGMLALGSEGLPLWRREEALVRN